VKKKQRIRGVNFKNDLLMLLMNILFFIFYYFPTIIIELSFINTINLDSIVNDKSINSTNNSFNKISFYDYSFSIVGIFFTVILLIIYAIINYNFEKYLITPHGINLYDLKGDIFGLNFKFILLPLLQGFLVYDLLIDSEENIKGKIIIKLTLKIIFVMFYFISIKNFHKKFSTYFELFLINFSFFLCIIDFLFIDIFINNIPLNSIDSIVAKNDLNFNIISNSTHSKNNSTLFNETFNSNITSTITNSNYNKSASINTIFYDKIFKSIFVDSNELYFSVKLSIIKLIFSGLLSIIVIKIIEYYEIKYISCFYESTKRNIFTYFDKLLFFLKNLDNFSSTYVTQIVTHFLIEIKYHNTQCRLEYCSCGKSLRIFKDILDFKKIENEKILSLFKRFIDENIKFLLINCKNEAEYSKKFEIILIETYFCFYFKKYYITSFFNVDKLRKFSASINSSICTSRLKILKLEIIRTFLEKNKNSKNTVFTNLYSNFNYFLKFKDLQEKSEKCFEFYKYIISKFAEYNFKNTKFNEISNLKNNSEKKEKDSQFFNIGKFKSENQIFHNKNFFSYNISEFQRDLQILKYLIESTNEDIKLMVKEKFYYNPIYFKNISMFTKFFLNKDFYKDIYLSNIKINRKNNDPLEECNGENSSDAFLFKEIRKSEENDWDRAIIRNNKKNLFVFEKASARFSQDLGFRNNEMVGLELNSFIPFNFVEFHQNHVLDFLNKNNLIVENKEVYFQTKSGYCLNYIISGTVILSLNEDVLIFCELRKLSNLIEKYHEKAFISCELSGEIMAYDYGVNHHFNLDSNTINILKPNFFKNFLNHNTNNINFNLNSFVIEIDYLKILKNIQNLDFSRLIDVKSKEFEYSISKKISNTIKNTKDGKITIKFNKRNLLKKFYFFDVRMDMSKIKKGNFIMNIPIDFGTLYKNHTNAFSQSSKSYEKVGKEKMFNKKVLENIKILTINNTTNKSYIFENLKIYEKILIDYFDFNSNIKGLKEKPLSIENKMPKQKFEFKEITKFISKNNKIPFIEDTNKINLLNRLIILTIFLLFYLFEYYYVDLSNDELYSKGKIFIEFQHRTVIIKNYILNLSNSFFSIFFLLNNFEPSSFSYLTSKGFDKIDNSISHHYYQVSNKSDLFLESAYYFQTSYSKYGSFLLNPKNNIQDDFLIKKLNSDWTVSEDNYTLYQNIYLFHYICKRIKLDEIENSKFLFFNFTDNSFSSSPTSTDLSLFFFMENVLGQITIKMDDLIRFEEESFEKFKNDQIVFVFSVYILSGVIGILFLIYQSKLYYDEFFVIYKKYFILYNSIKVYYVLLFKKIITIMIIFNDFFYSRKFK